jgi:hypothetical protein
VNKEGVAFKFFTEQRIANKHRQALSFQLKKFLNSRSNLKGVDSVAMPMRILKPTKRMLALQMMRLC